jgi:hypothetical protein
MNSSVKFLLITLSFCINLTAWATWQSSADNLAHTRSGGSSYPPIINTDGSALMIIDYNAVTAYGRAPNSNWNLIGELLISDPMLSDYDSFDISFAHSSSLERFALCKDQTWQYDSEAGTSQNIPAKITVLNFTNSVWSSNEFSLPQKYSRIDDIGMSKNGNRIAIKTTSDDSYLGYSEILVYENILGSWIPVGGPINIGYLSTTNGIRLDESGDSLTIGYNAYNQSENFIYISPVKVYTYSNGSWNQKGQKIYPSEDFDAHGFDVDISDDGQRIAISSPYFNSGGKVDSGRVDIYQFANNEWQHITNIYGENAGDLFGLNFSFSDNGNRIAIGSELHDNESGHIRVFDFDSSSYDYLQIGNDINGLEYENIGGRFAMSGDGTTIISMNASWAVQPDPSGVFTDTLKTFGYSAPTDESLDTDGDGLTNATEISLGTNPNLRDSDSDGLPDGWEVSRNLDPTSNSTDFIEEMNSFGYYSQNQMQDLRPGSTMIEVSGNQATVQLQMEESSDLQTWQDTGTPATMTIPADTDTKFFRFKMAE